MPSGEEGMFKCVCRQDVNDQEFEWLLQKCPALGCAPRGSHSGGSALSASSEQGSLCQEVADASRGGSLAGRRGWNG